MGDSSDGGTDAEEKKRLESSFLRLNRSHSVGSTNFNQAKMNIPYNLEEIKMPKQVKTYLDKLKKKSIDGDKQTGDIRGQSNKSELNINAKISQDEVFIDTHIFKPTTKIIRTPPRIFNLENNSTTESNLNKRIRSENSPEIENVSKKPCGLTEPVQNDTKLKEAEMKKLNPEYSKLPNAETSETEDSETKTAIKNLNTEKIILEIYSSLESIQESTTKTNNGIVTLSTEDQETIRTSSNSIQKYLTLLVCQLGNLEKENLTLQYQNDSLKQNGTKVYPKMTKTYATAINTKTTAIHTNQNQPQNNVDTEISDILWTTPKIRKKHETLIRIENVSDSKIVAAQLKTNNYTNDTNGGFKNIRHLKSGAIIIESHDQTQQEKLKVALQDKKHLQAKEFQGSDPMFVVTGIEKGFSDEEFVKEIIRLNNEIETELGYEVYEKIKVITKKQCRNVAKENWILQASPEVAKWFLKRNVINFDFLKVYVQEHLNLAICFRCSGFGHVAKYCNEKQCCPKCGKQHASKDCIEETLKCPNCIKQKFKEAESCHSARDSSCPVYKRHLNRYRKNINYQSSFL